MQSNRKVDGLGIVRRFSLCSCMTLYFPNTYTAHGMTLDYFNRKALPGKRTFIPFPFFRPDADVHEYKIPQKVSTVLFSPFNEAYLPRYRFEGYSDDYTIGLHKGTELLKRKATKISRISVEDFAEDLLEFEAKVDKIWDNPLKILVLYDHSRAGVPVRKRMTAFAEVSKATVKWPIVQMEDPNSTRKEWCHYTDLGLATVLQKITSLEKEFRK